MVRTRLLALSLEQSLVVLVIDQFPVVEEQTGRPVTLQKAAFFNTIRSLA